MPAVPESGSLVHIINENGDDMGTGIYLELMIPGEFDLDMYDLLLDIEYVDSRFRKEANHKVPSYFFYAIPEHWHYVLLVGDRVVHLNTGFYTLTEVGSGG